MGFQRTVRSAIRIDYVAATAIAHPCLQSAVLQFRGVRFRRPAHGLHRHSPACHGYKQSPNPHMNLLSPQGLARAPYYYLYHYYYYHYYYHDYY